MPLSRAKTEYDVVPSAEDVTEIEIEREITTPQREPRQLDITDYYRE